MIYFFVFPNGFAEKNTAIPNFGLVNQASLDKILKAEVFVHTDGQLRAAHLILDYVPISKVFQVPKCMIKARDPLLQRISVAAPGFLISGPIPEGIFATGSILEGIPKVAVPPQQATEVATSSHPTNTEEEEVVEVSDSEDEFEIFNQALSLDISTFDLSPSIHIDT